NKECDHLLRKMLISTSALERINASHCARLSYKMDKQFTSQYDGIVLRGPCQAQNQANWPGPDKIHRNNENTLIEARRALAALEGAESEHEQREKGTMFTINHAIHLTLFFPSSWIALLLISIGDRTEKCTL